MLKISQMTQRRTFLRQTAGLLGGLGTAQLLPFSSLTTLHASITDAIAQGSGDASDEDFWAIIRQAYTTSPQLINLNNGGVSPQPVAVQKAMIRYYELCNEGPSYYMWRVLDEGREALRRRLALLSGCDPEEIAINRNSSEALETVIFGLPLQKGDEVILAKQDYPNMINAWKQREKREGIVLKWVNLELPSEDEDYLVSTYINTISAKTKVIQLTHVINWNGQVLPVRKIADEAHRRNIEVLIDAAHSFAHLHYRIPELGGDYYGTSLHKWLSAPFGSGMLWIKKDKISKIWPLLAPPEPESDDIRKFEALGTRSLPIEYAIGEAIDFEEMIGIERKSKRLWYLKHYWTTKALEIPGVSIGSPLSPAWSGAIALLQVTGKTPHEVSNALHQKYKIHTVAIEWENISGVRITPHVYTSLRDLDHLVESVRKIATT